MQVMKHTDAYPMKTTKMENLHKYLQNELKVYPKAAENYEKLKSVKTKEFKYEGFSIYVHFNPARAVSSLAKLDAKSIAERPCFLCAKNRPKVQGSIDYNGRFDICVNPFPICWEHFTIISKQHELQRLNTEKIEYFYRLAKDLEGWIVLYNGAKSGASAPDHFHFQAVGPDFFPYPVETPMPGIISKIVLKATTAEEASEKLQAVLSELSNGEWHSLEIGDPTDSHEPQINLFCEYKNGEFVTTIFPRKCHRPRQFFAEDETKIMISPGAIDMTGHLIVARQEDFDKISKEILLDIFQQVSIV